MIKALRGEAPTRAEISLAADIAAEGRSLVVVANKTDELTPVQRHQVPPCPFAAASSGIIFALHVETSLR